MSVDEICAQLLKAKVAKGEVKININGDSMAPTIEPNQQITIKSAESIELGNVVCFFNNDSCIAHRVVRICGDAITTKGDNGVRLDEPITREQVIGKVSVLAGGRRYCFDESIDRKIAFYSNLQGMAFSSIIVNPIFMLLHHIRCVLTPKNGTFTRTYARISKTLIRAFFRCI